MFEDIQEKEKQCEVYCPYCFQKAQLVSGQIIYPHATYLWHGYFYLCEPCEAYVGTHKSTLKPLGLPAKKELRQARKDAHEFFDKLWRSKRKSRSQAYRWLAEKLKIHINKCHIGFFDLATCYNVIEICEEEEKRAKKRK